MINGLILKIYYLILVIFMNIKSIGSTLIFFWVFAIALDFIGMVPVILAWIYTWWETTAWVIKLWLIIWGAGLFFYWKDIPQETENG